MNRKRKYGNRQVEYDGYTFDSKKEAIRWAELKLMERSGQITDLKRQIRFDLIPMLREESTERYVRGPKKGQLKPGKILERPTYYIADFVYTEDGKTVAEDAKGFKTKDYMLKRKMMLWIHGIRIREV